MGASRLQRLAGANNTQTMKDFWRGNHAEQTEIFARKESLASTINRLMIRRFCRGQSMLPLVICAVVGRIVVFHGFRNFIVRILLAPARETGPRRATTSGTSYIYVANQYRSNIPTLFWEGRHLFAKVRRSLSVSSLCYFVNYLA